MICPVSQFIRLIIFLRYFSTMRLKNLYQNSIAILILMVITISQSQDNEINPTKVQNNMNNQNEVQKKQYQLEQQFKKQTQNELSEWVVQQMNQNEQHPQIQPYESVIFLIQPNVTQNYRIPVSLTQTMMIQVSVFELTNYGQVVVPDNPTQENYVQVSSIDDNSHISIKEGKVYISKIMELKFSETHKFLKFKNNADRSLIVLLDLQQQQILMQIVVSDDQFTLTNKKMQTILQETKNTQANREHMYKWQWGFYQKHQRHQQDMLGLTGTELLVIIGTSIVQMYCIKNLIDKELII